jgi:dTDP-glucose 4,6-dehydratase
MKIVMITGCLGFIGSHFVERALQYGWKVIGVDSCTYAANLDILEVFLKNKNFSFLRKDICELDSLPDCDYLINFAAESHVENSIVNSEKFIKTNIFGVNNLLNLLKNKSNNSYYKPLFVQISTDEVYGDVTDGAFCELSQINPSNPYAASKASADLMIKSWSRTYEINYLIIRPTNNYGIRQYPEKLIPLTVKNLLRNKKTKMHNGGEPIRNWLHVEDTVCAIMSILKDGSINTVYNVAGNLEQKNKDTIKKIIDSFFENKVDWTQHIDVCENRPGQDVRYALDDSKIKSIGWNAEKNFDEEIQIIVNWYKENIRWI